MSYKNSLDMKMESQDVNYQLYLDYLPEKWEMIDGKLLSSEKELLNVLELLIYHAGVKHSLDLIPTALIETYLERKKYNKKEER